MLIFLSYKFTNIPIDILNNSVVPLILKIRSLGFDIFCNFEKNDFYIKEKWLYNQIMHDCIQELIKCNYCIFFIAPDTTIGNGMLIEYEYAKKINLPVLLVAPTSFKTTLIMADSKIEYDSIDDMYEKLEKFLFTLSK